MQIMINMALIMKQWGLSWVCRIPNNININNPNPNIWTPYFESVVLRHYFNSIIFTFGRCGTQSSFTFLAVSCLVSVRPRSTTIGICNNNNSGRIVRGNVSVIGTGLMLAHRELVFMLQEEDTWPAALPALYTRATMLDTRHWLTT